MLSLVLRNERYVRIESIHGALETGAIQRSRKVLKQELREALGCSPEAFAEAADEDNCGDDDDYDGANEDGQV